MVLASWSNLQTLAPLTLYTRPIICRCRTSVTPEPIFEVIGRHCVSMIKEAIIKTFNEVGLESLNFATDTNRKKSFAVLHKLIGVAGRIIPDHNLRNLSTKEDLINFFSTPQIVSPKKGVPYLEIFGGKTLPGNVSILNYSKRKWGKTATFSFLNKALAAESTAKV